MLTLFAGDTEPTLTRVQMRDRGDGRLVPGFDANGLHAPGDGTVPRYSALADERTGIAIRRRFVSPVPWERITFLPRGHLELTRDPVFVDNLLWQLLEEPVLVREAER